MERKYFSKNEYIFLKEDGFLVTYCAKGIVKRTMKSVGFEIIVLDGPPGKRQMTRAKNLLFKNSIYSNFDPFISTIKY